MPVPERNPAGIGNAADADNAAIPADALDEQLEPRAPEVVAFDIGEVLIDESRVWHIWAELVGTTPLTFAAVLGAAIVQGSDHHEAFAHVAPNVDWTALTDDHETSLGGLQATDLYGDVRDCLAQLRHLGFRVVVAGNQPAIRAEQLRALSLDVDTIITSEELGVEKPDPAFFSALLDVCGVTSAAQVLYVGDRVDNDVLPAMDAGLRTCWLRRGPWGLLQDIPENVEVDVVLEGLGELPELLSAWRST